MKRFLIDTSVLNAEGSQTWFVDAETEKEALAKFKKGDCDLYESNVDVTSLDDPEISGEVPLDDFGHFAPEEALTCSVCGVETQNPWHYSTPTSRHEHACDKCWPTAQTSHVAGAFNAGWQAMQKAALQERMLVDPAEYDDYGAAVQRNKVIGAAHKVGGAT